MKRPEQHVTDSDADALFRAVFSEWAVNGSSRDYGWDYTVEVFRTGQSTGFLFNVQLKGSRNTEYSTDGSFISQEMEIDSADYLARQLRQPTFLIHADVVKKKLFWNAIQLDQKVLETLRHSQAKTLTIRIPTANALPERFAQFAQDLNHSQTVVMSRIFAGTRAAEYVDVMVSQRIERMTEVAEDLHGKAFLLELRAAFQQRRNGDFDGALAAIRKVAVSARASGHVEMHFNATLQSREMEGLQMFRSDVPQATLAQKKLATALELCHIAKRKPKHLHLFAQMTRKAAELGIAVQHSLGLLISWRDNSLRGEDPLWVAVLSFQVQENLLAVHKKYNQFVRFARVVAKSRFRKVTSRPVAEIAFDIGKLASLLDAAVLVDTGLQYRRSALDLLKFSATVAIENGSKHDLIHAATLAKRLDQEDDGAMSEWVRSIVERWPQNDEYRRDAEELLKNQFPNVLGAKTDNETRLRQIHRSILTSAGIDPTMEPWVKSIELAVKDDDPTRVLMDCQHKVVLTHPDGDIVLDRLGLEKANPKIIGCNVHRHVLDGLELDEIDRVFKIKFCSSCLDRVPRPEDWTFYPKNS